MNRKEIEQWRKLSEKGRADLLGMIKDKGGRVMVSNKSGQSYAYISDFGAGRKRMSDTRIFIILDKVVE